MYIVFFSHYFPPESNAPASRTYENCKRWVKKGHKVKVITCAPNTPNGVVYEGYKNRLYQRENIDGIDVVRVWTFVSANKGTTRRILNYLSFMFSAVIIGLFIQKPDIIIATSPQFFCGWAGVFVSRIRRSPLLLEIRDLWPDSIVAVGAITNHKIIGFLEKLEKILYAAATHIVTVGEGYKRQIVAKGVDANKITVITNGVDTELFYPRKADEGIRKQHNLNSEFVCAYVGTLGMASGLNIVIRAGKILKERGHRKIKFMLIGDGAIRHQLERKARIENLDNIIFTGMLPKESVPGYLASVDACLVHLIKADLFKSVLPSKIFEAAAMERPIILGVQGDSAKLISDASAGICIEPENAEELVKAMLSLAHNKNLKEKYGRSGHKYVIRHFNRTILANHYLELIHLLLARHSVQYAKESIDKTRRLIRKYNQQISRISNLQENKQEIPITDHMK